jgi:hypothetical protein
MKAETQRGTKEYNPVGTELGTGLGNSAAYMANMSACMNGAMPYMRK